MYFRHTIAAGRAGPALRRSIAVTVAALIGLTLTAVGPPADAKSKAATIEFAVFESVAQASNGDTVEIDGAGSFTLHPKSVSGDAPAIEAALGSVPRTFTHRDASGDVLASGTWEPTKLLSFHSFGPATQEQIDAFGGLPPGSEGGKVKFKVALFVDGVHVHNGIVTIVCLLGVPPKNAEESTLLLVQGTSFNFHTVVEGDNLLIRES
jgi:hypothetical protein